MPPPARSVEIVYRYALRQDREQRIIQKNGVISSEYIILKNKFCLFFGLYSISMSTYQLYLVITAHTYRMMHGRSDESLLSAEPKKKRESFLTVRIPMRLCNADSCIIGA